MKKCILCLIQLLIFLFFLFFPTETFEASKRGLLLWFDTLLPTLLPFLILSQTILKTSLTDSLQKFFGPIFRRIFHCSEEGAFCLLCGFLCGCPVGAKLIAFSVHEHRLKEEEGQYLLSFCNQVSPIFCISYGIIYGIGSKNLVPYLLIIYGSAILLGLLTRPRLLPASDFSAKKQTSPVETIFQLIDVCIIDSFYVLIKLCGYLILFSIFNQIFFMAIPVHTPAVTAALASILEITNGLNHVHSLSPGPLRSAIGIAALSFGGFCCAFQTNSVISSTSLSLRKYLYSKGLHALLALFLYFLWSFSCFAINCWC